MALRPSQVATAPIADMFGNQRGIPQPRQAINDNKDQARLKDTSVIGRASNDILAAHGLQPETTQFADILPTPASQRPPQRQPVRTQIAIMLPQGSVTMPTPRSQRPTSATAAGFPALAFTSPARSSVSSPATRAVAAVAPRQQAPRIAPQAQQGGGGGQTFNPSNHSQAKMEAVAAGRSYFTGSDGGMQPTHAMNGKLRNTY